MITTLFRGRAGGNRGPVDRWLEITRNDSGRVTVMILSARKVSLGAMRMTSLDARRAGAGLPGAAITNDPRTILRRVARKDITAEQMAAPDRLRNFAERRWS
jgi:hypothetical protein